MTYRAHERRDLGFSTRQVHAGYDPAQHNYAKNVPVYQTAAFEFGDFERSVRVCTTHVPGEMSYSRTSNPTNKVLEDRIASLDGGEAALSFASGMAAIAATLVNLCEQGDEVVAACSLYGDTVTLLADVLPRYGVAARIVEDPDDPAAFEALMGERTKAVYLESLGNPRLNIVDLEAVAKAAHARGIPVVVDNTFATPYLFRPFEHGADIDVYSATKYLAGHGTTLAGLVVERGGFDWACGRFPQMEAFREEARASIPAGMLERQLFTRRLYTRSLGLFGGHLAAQSAFSVIQGMETLSLRMERHAANAQAVAEFLVGHPKVAQVDFPGLAGSPYHALAERYFPRGLTGMLSFRLAGGWQAVGPFLDGLEVFDDMVNVGDTKSYAVYPALATHLGLSPEEQRRAGVWPDTIRLSVGIEDADDLIADLDQALARA